jgi:hypothetical protein
MAKRKEGYRVLVNPAFDTKKWLYWCMAKSHGHAVELITKSMGWDTCTLGEFYSVSVIQSADIPVSYGEQS